MIYRLVRGYRRCPHSHGLPRGRGPSENAPCKLDGILYFKLNPSSETVYYPGHFPHPELLCVLDHIHTHTKNFCEFCTTVIPVPGTSVRSVRPCHNVRRTGTALSFLPGTSASYVRSCHNTRNIWKFSKTLIPVPGISVSSVRPVPQYPGYGYSTFFTRPELLCVLYPRAKIPGSSVSSVTHTYPHLKLLEVQ